MSERIVSAWVVPAGIDLTGPAVPVGCHECPDDDEGPASTEMLATAMTVKISN